MINKEFWSGKRVFLTGHTGFKGSWMSLWLHSLGAVVKGYALNPPTLPSLFDKANIDLLIESEIGDIRDQKKLQESMLSFDPDILIHMAAQPLVRHSYEFPIETYDTNVMGTVKVLGVARSCDNLRAIINVTTDKCYENEGYDKSYSESDPMGGFDPYSSSKGCAELVASAYSRSFYKDKEVGIASVRAGNVIGGGDWAKDRLIPDILRSFEKRESVIIRNPKATRPWQHVLEPLSGYLILAQRLYSDYESFSGGWNFGPEREDVRPVSWIIKEMTKKWPDSNWKLDKGENPHESDFLSLDISKAKLKLNWHPTWSLKTTLNKIVLWHKAWLDNDDMQAACLSEIEEYMKDMRHGNT